MSFHAASNCAMILLLLLNCIVPLSCNKISVVMRSDIDINGYRPSLAVLSQHHFIASHHTCIVAMSIGFDSHRNTIKKANRIATLHRVAITSIASIALEDKNNNSYNALRFISVNVHSFLQSVNECGTLLFCSFSKHD